jgi:hypothetical protein
MTATDPKQPFAGHDAKRDETTVFSDIAYN